MVLSSEVKKLHKNNVRLKVVGDTSRFDNKLIAKIAEAEELTAGNDGLTLNIAAKYGGRGDIVDAAKTIAEQVKAGQIDAQDINEALFTKHTSLAGLPELDLLIRTGGEQRVSNFLLWQLAYSELYFTDTYWPDFDEPAFQRAVDDFAERQRRYGMTSEQVT